MSRIKHSISAILTAILTLYSSCSYPFARHEPGPAFWKAVARPLAPLLRFFYISCVALSVANIKAAHSIRHSFRHNFLVDRVKLN